MAVLAVKETRSSSTWYMVLAYHPLPPPTGATAGFLSYILSVSIFYLIGRNILGKVQVLYLRPQEGQVPAALHWSFPLEHPSCFFFS